MLIRVLHYAPLAVGLGSWTARESGGQIAVAAITDDVDESVRAEFTTALADAVDNTDNALIVDMTRTNFLGMRSALALADVQIHSDLQHRGLLLVPSYPASRILAVTGLLERFRRFPTVQNAVAALRADQAVA
ncbi:STAS domain-containing protein [Rhodococcus triatomae]|nr:anti sigma factor antagonist [Rhodococcus triatomae BKS 15-14]